MSDNSLCSTSRSTAWPVLVFLLVAYSLWEVWLAVGHGVMAWGAMAEYSLYPYLLILGMACSGLVFVLSGSKGGGLGLRASFLLLFLGYGNALAHAQPLRAVPADMRWMFEYVAYVTGFAVIAAGIVVEARLRGRY